MLRLRECLLLLAAACAALLSLTQEGDLSVTHAFFHPVERHAATTLGQPPGTAEDGGGAPMASFANGVAPAENELVSAAAARRSAEGGGGSEQRDSCRESEVVIVTREPKLKIFKFKSTLNVRSQGVHTLYTHAAVDWQQLVLVREVGLLSNLLVTAGRQAVGLSSGYLRPYSSRRNRKQVIVLVNEAWGILVFNHKLRLMWTRTIESDLALRYLAEVAILIDPHPLRQASAAGARGGGRNDTGVIIVGGRLALKSSLGRREGPAHSLHRDSLDGGQAGPAPLEFPADYAEALQGRILRPGRTKGSWTSDEPRDRESGQAEVLGADPLHFEREQHFSYYAFEGRTGESRWRHDSSSFLEEQHPSDLLRPQHEAMHSGEQDWRVFRQSLLEHALPHAWQGGREATSFDLAHMEKTRSGHTRQKKRKARQTKSAFFVKNALGMRPHRESEHVLRPNAIVVHLRDGIEVLHLYSGRPLCRLTLQSGAVHVDMNGDGVIDHVEAVGGVHEPRSRAHTKAGAQHAHDAPPLPKCLAIVRSGVPPTRQLFNASICHTNWAERIKFGRGGGLFPDDFLPATAATAGADASPTPLTGRGRGSSKGFSLEGGIGSSEQPSMAATAASVFGGMLRDTTDTQNGDVRVAHPIVIQEPRTAGKSSKKRRYHSFFFLNTGLVSSFNHDGSRAWHVATNCKWLRQHKADSVLSAAEDAFRPSLSAFTLHEDSALAADHVLVVGEHAASLVSLAGSLRASVALAKHASVIAPPIIGDFDGDGVSDFVLVTNKGFHGYRVERRLGGQLFSILVGALLCMLALLLVFKAVNSGAITRAATKLRLGVQGRSKTATGGVRILGKSTKAQL